MTKAYYLFLLDDPVLYTVMELVPGMIKVRSVWLGALELPNNRSAASHILDWCQTKLVPDGARDILVSVFSTCICDDVSLMSTRSCTLKRKILSTIPYR